MVAHQPCLHKLLSLRPGDRSQLDSPCIVFIEQQQKHRSAASRARSPRSSLQCPFWGSGVSRFGGWRAHEPSSRTAGIPDAHCYLITHTSPAGRLQAPVASLVCPSNPAFTMSDVTPQTNTPYPEPPAKKRNDLAIELISGSVGGATQVLVGQVSDITLQGMCL